WRQGKKAKREVRLAASGAAAEESRVGPECHACAVDQLTRLAQAAGNRITKRAPLILRSAAPTLLTLRPSPFCARFSAHRRPPWATTICREILRARPEFWPKLSCGRSV